MEKVHRSDAPSARNPTKRNDFVEKVPENGRSVVVKALEELYEPLSEWPWVISAEPSSFLSLSKTRHVKTDWAKVVEGSVVRIARTRAVTRKKCDSSLLLCERFMSLRTWAAKDSGRTIFEKEKQMQP